MMTDRDIQVLLAVDKYYVLNRPQIQGLCFESDKTGRVTRRRLQTLVSGRFLNRHRAQVHYPGSAPAGSIYYPSKRGSEFLAEHTGDDRYLLTPDQCPQPHHVLHWLAVSDTHIALDRSIACQDRVSVDGWINEWDVVNKDERDPQKRFRLYTLLNENPRLICAPDAAFLLSVLGFSKVFYVEQDRGTTGVKQVAARKIKGFAELLQRGLHRSHFPETNVDSFTVLCVAHNARRRDALRKAFAGLTGADLWRFCAAPEVTPKRILHDAIIYPAVGDAIPLVKPEVGK
jgi:hypothetical protein